MSEEKEGQDTGAEAVAGSVDPIAIALALGGASRTKADEFLDNQSSLIDIQKHHLHVQLKEVHLSIWKEYLGVLLRVATAVVGLAVASGIALMMRDASRSSGLLIEPFSVPPELAARGLTGEVVAARFLDKLQAMQAATGSDRPASSFQNNWGSEIKVEIPETGLTFGELDKLLRDKFGHASHVSGEVFKTADGVALTARLGNTLPQTFTGADAKIDDLAQQAAEAIYRDSQPYRFSQYLDQHGRIAEAFAVIAKLATDGPREERGWAYAQWSLMDTNDHGDATAARVHGLQALFRLGRFGRDAPPWEACLTQIYVSAKNGGPSAAVFIRADDVIGWVTNVCYWRKRTSGGMNDRFCEVETSRQRNNEVRTRIWRPPCAAWWPPLALFEVGTMPKHNSRCGIRRGISRQDSDCTRWLR